MIRNIIAVLLILISFPVLSQNASLMGRVFDKESNEPLPFTNLIIDGTTIGSTSDLDGNFTFTGLKPGFIRLVSTSVGYERFITEEIQVTTAKTAVIDVAMVPTQVKLSGVEIKSSVIKRIEESPVSVQSLGISQIEKSPGANRDISKVVQLLPGVASAASFRNDLIVRGGGPAENRFYLDGIEIPNLNHFATQGASGGSNGIINTDFIREVDFYSGAFPANKGNTLSSILDMRLIDGNIEKSVFKATLGASEAAISANGPIGNKTTYLLSLRRSYLQFLFSAIGLPFLPTFNDYTFKVKTKFDLKNELTIVSIGALDNFKLNTGIKNPTEDQQYILDYLPVNEQWSYAIGGVYKHYRKNSTATLVLSRNMLNNVSFKHVNNDESLPKKLDYSSQEIENKIRYEETTRLKNWKFIYGAGAEFVKFNVNTKQKVFIVTPVDTITQVSYITDINFFKGYIFAQASKSLLNNKLNLSLGFRDDMNTYSLLMMTPKYISPRISASYAVAPRININFNAGRYYQLPSYTILGFRDAAGTLVNKDNDITYISSNHIVIGAEYNRTTNSRLSIEGFIKMYDSYPISLNDSVSLASKGADYGVTGNEAVVATGKGRAYGAELFYRDNITYWLNVLLSYTFVRSEFEDINNKSIPSSWDNRHILNVTLLGSLNNNWSIGVRGKFLGGTPYTPYDENISSLIAAWDVQNVAYIDYSRYNQLRLGNFYQVDLRVDKEFFFKNWSLNLYLDVQNLTNFQFKGPEVLLPQTDGSGNKIIDPVDSSRYLMRYISNTSGTILPSLGIIVEF